MVDVPSGWGAFTMELHVVEFIGIRFEFGTAGVPHASQPPSPTEDICHKISKENASSQIRMDKERFRDNARAAIAPIGGAEKIFGHLLNEHMGLGFFQFIKDDQATFAWGKCFQKIEIALEKILVVLAEGVGGRARGLNIDHRGNNLDAVPGGNV